MNSDQSLGSLLNVFTYDKSNKSELLDLNIDIRTRLTRELLEKGVNQLDPKQITAALKALGDNDKVILSQERLKQDATDSQQQADIIALMSKKLRGDIGKDNDLPSTGAPIVRPERNTDDMTIKTSALIIGNDINDSELVKLTKVGS